jgi:hypothetical protein
LAEQVADAGSEFAAYRVDRSGRWPWRDQGNATRRIIIAMRRRHRECQTGNGEKRFHDAAHDSSPGSAILSKRLTTAL